jgi:hypothetical protein
VKCHRSDTTGQGWRTFLRARVQIVNFKEIHSRANGNFEEQNMVLWPPIKIINYLIIINAHYK